MLTAEEARRITRLPYKDIDNKIREAANMDKGYAVIESALPKNCISYLHSLGYAVTEEPYPIYEDTPYGQTDTILGMRIKTIIKWMEQK